MSAHLADHFEDIEKQARAARLGIWVFLASELLFFAGLFALYAGYRVEHPYGFGVGIASNTVTLGSLNTVVLLVSSYTIALAVHQLRGGRQRAAAGLVIATMLLGVAFIVIKMSEYLKHFEDGIYPAGVGSFFVQHNDAGTKMFFTLYFCMTGLHAIHVVAGLGLLAFLLVKVLRRSIDSQHSYPLAIGAVYWHLVDVIWIFLWPLLYLTPGGAR